MTFKVLCLQYKFIPLFLTKYNTLWYENEFQILVLPFLDLPLKLECPSMKYCVVKETKMQLMEINTLRVALINKCFIDINLENMICLVLINEMYHLDLSSPIVM